MGTSAGIQSCRTMRVTCPECGYTTSTSIGSTFKIPDEYVKACKHPPEKRKTTEYKKEGAVCPYLIEAIDRDLYGHSKGKR